MGGYVNISPELLIEVTTKCLDNISNYNGEDDVQKTYYDDWLLFKVKRTYTETPTWTYSGCGIITRLNELRDVAEEVLLDDRVEDRDIKLTITTHNELFKLLNKEKGFQPYIFGNGY